MNQKSPVHKVKKTIVVLALSFIGFLDAVYLTIEHYTGGIPPCGLEGGCESVLTSSYSAIGPIPTSLLGALFYLMVFFLTLSYRHTGQKRLRSLLMLVATLGFLVSLGLFFIQWQVIEAFCTYCLVSFTLSTLIFAFVWDMILNSKVEEEGSQ